MDLSFCFSYQNHRENSYILIIYTSKKHSGKRRNLKYIQVHNYAPVTGVNNKTMVKLISNITSCKYNKCGNPRNR